VSHRIQYSDEARAALRALEVGGINDRRQAAVAGTVTMYGISQNVLTISVVTIVHTG
jgi:hypothetical protein